MIPRQFVQPSLCRALPRPPNFVDGPEQFLAVAQRDSEFFKVVFGQIRKDGIIDIVFGKRLGVLAQSVSRQPLGYVSGRPRHCTDLVHER